jgi:hypothetical protein
MGMRIYAGGSRSLLSGWSRQSGWSRGLDILLEGPPEVRETLSIQPSY